MIPRYQKIVFMVLIVVSVAMGVVLVRLRERAHDRLLKGEDIAPTTAPAVAPAEQATLLVANDMDGTLVTVQRSLPLPKDPEARARALVERLLESYAAAGAMHPMPGVPRAVEQVFLLPVASGEAGGKSQAVTSRPVASRAGTSRPAKSELATSEAKTTEAGGDELAVVNLAGAFADGHPGGIEAETLTVLSICGTLHANLPRIVQVRFLVGGQVRKTLSGHADLTRTYLVGGAADGQTH